MRTKILSLLVLLLTAATGAWAQETPLVTIESKDYKSFKSGSMTFDDKVTVTFSSSVDNDGDETGWYSYSARTLTVTAAEGYTITSCKFYTYEGPAANGYTVEGESPSVCLSAWQVLTDDKSVTIGEPGITKIEVYGAAASSAASGPEVAWDKASKTGTFTMPGGNVELEVEYETELALSEATDNTATLDEWDGYEADVTLTRTLQAGGYNTFALPFSTAIPEGWTVKELNTASFADEVLTLNFVTASSIEAGKPYLVKVAANADLSQAAFAGAIVSMETVPYTSATVDFIPTLGATSIVTDDVRKILFLGAENTLYRPESTSSMMKGFRAYFQLKEAAEVKGYVLDFGDEATGIVEIENGKFKIQDDVIYNVAGQRLQRTQKGVNIVSGKKLIIK